MLSRRTADRPPKTLCLLNDGKAVVTAGADDLSPNAERARTRIFVHALLFANCPLFGRKNAVLIRLAGFCFALIVTAAGLTDRFDPRTDLRFCSVLSAAKLLPERNYFGHVKNYEL
ncbi:hypothetical protein [uncultured Ruminococcus sp.]|uniref:hypothetical protein n=1 Tax=uncultured Ruminococcus sp. TaxID=165186 RepID=UPI0025DE3154|nr:hypothetical protein [uncultured Ruminococcus sp.]